MALSTRLAVVGSRPARAVTSSASAFDPQTQGTLINWYDASTLGLSNGASVTTLVDSKTGAPNSMTVGTGTAGTYVTPAQNGLGTISFNGTNQWYTANGSTASSFPRTIAAVIKIPNTSASYTIIGPSDIGGLQLQIAATTGALALNKSNVVNIGTSSGTIGTGAYHAIIATVDSANYGFYIDSSSSAGSGSHAQTLTAARTFQVAVQTNASVAGEKFLGNIGELMLFSSVLNGTDIAGCMNFMKGKWNIP